MEPRAVQRRNRAGMPMGPRLDRHEVQMRDGPRDDDRDEAHRGQAKSRRDIGSGGRRGGRLGFRREIPGRTASRAGPRRLRAERSGRLYRSSQGPPLLSDPGGGKRLRYDQDEGHGDAGPWVDATHRHRYLPDFRIDHEDRADPDAPERLALYAPDA